MSIYAQAISSGIQALAGTEADRVYDATYNQVYATEAQKANIRNAMHSANLNMTAVEQDRILTNTSIQMKQDQAEAHATVAAATAGVEGGSVDDILYETEKNEALALSTAHQSAKQQKANLSTAIGTQMNSLLSVSDSLPKISYVDNLLGALSSFELSDLEVADAFKENWGGSSSPFDETTVRG